MMVARMIIVLASILAQPEAPIIPPAPRPAPGDIAEFPLVAADPQNTGSLPSGAIAMRRLTFRNDRAIPANLSIVSKTCGCLDAAFNSPSVQPGQTAVLNLSAQVTPTIGPQRQAVTFKAVWSEDGHTLTRTGVCDIIYSCKVGFEQTPRAESVIHLTALAGHEVRAPIALRWLDDKVEPDLKATNLRSDVPCVVLRGPYTTPGAMNVRLFELLARHDEPGIYNGRASFDTGCESPDRVVVPFQFRVLEPWRAEPPGAMFTRADRAERTLALAPRSDRPKGWTPDRVDVVGDPGLQSRLEQQEDRWLLRLWLDSGAAGSGAAQVRVLTPSNQLLAIVPVGWWKLNETTVPGDGPG